LDALELVDPVVDDLFGDVVLLLELLVAGCDVEVFFVDELDVLKQEQALDIFEG
jgi:hypothetical protein